MRLPLAIALISSIALLPAGGFAQQPKDAPGAERSDERPFGGPPPMQPRTRTIPSRALECKLAKGSCALQKPARAGEDCECTVGGAKVKGKVE